ncbi:hypothetical protein SDC9_125244 [bioreactor metagenome]|uniref:Uncharacterized protein n=1 Tax=bioreactor metagenome TaxID=1076179 RepID=A0A645CMR5_9ZZZZ
MLQRGLAHRADDVAHIGLLQHQRRDHLRRVQRLHMHLHLGIFLAKPGHGARQHITAEREHGEHGQPVRRLAMAQVDGQALHLVKLLEQLLDVRKQHLRLVGGHKASACALEQRKAQLQFGVLQRAADRWLRDVDEPRRSAHAAGLHDGVEDLDVAQAHGRASLLFLRVVLRVVLRGARQAFALPVHIVAAVHAVEHARQHEQQIGQAVEVLTRRGAHAAVALLQCHHRTLGAACHGAAHMRLRRRARACGQNEFLQARQLRVVVRKRVVELQQAIVLEQFKARDRQLTAQVEQLMLHVDQQLAHINGQRLAQQQSDV